ncbi:MAG: VOC family protein [Myxococcales bacterium]|nr:VOC family protein [Myxococcales bacterium]
MRGVLILVLLLAACSGDDSAAGDGSTAKKDAGGSAEGKGTSGSATGDETTKAGDAATSASDKDAGGSGDTKPAVVSDPVVCAPRELGEDGPMHFHHVHFNTTDPEADMEFFETFLNAPAVDFCNAADGGGVTRATHTERGYFLYTRVPEPADPALNTYLEHIGWIHPSPTDELMRLVELGAPLYPEGRSQCPEAAAGIMACGVSIFPEYFFYLQAPSGARVEVAIGPGPADSGFGHVHMIQGVSMDFFTTVSGGAFNAGAIDAVNHTDASLTEDRLATEMVTDTRGKPIDHIAYSTTDLEREKARIEAAGIAIEEDIAMRDEYGFRSFFVRSPKGIWVEIVEDSAFTP